MTSPATGSPYDEGEALTAAPTLVTFDPTLDKRHLSTAIGQDIQAWLSWLEVSNNRPRTLDQYERDVAKMALLYPDLPLRKYTDAEVLRTIRTWPPPSRYPRSKALASFFAWARLTRRIRENPMELVPKIKKRKAPHIETFTEGEVDDLLSLPARDAVLMAILCGAGLRKSEAINLQVRRLHVAEEPARIVVIGGKGDKDRTVHPFPEKAEIVHEFLLMNRLEPTDHLWYSKPGGRSVTRRRDPIGTTSFQRWWERCLDEAGVRKGAGPRERHPHIARHTFATEWLRRGGRLEVLSGELGHESIKTTFDLYAHLDTRDVLVDLAVIGENRPERNA